MSFNYISNLIFTQIPDPVIEEFDDDYELEPEELEDP